MSFVPSLTGNPDLAAIPPHCPNLTFLSFETCSMMLNLQCCGDGVGAATSCPSQWLLSESSELMVAMST